MPLEACFRGELLAALCAPSTGRMFAQVGEASSTLVALVGTPMLAHAVRAAGGEMPAGISGNAHRHQADSHECSCPRSPSRCNCTIVEAANS
jgi:hypothetical protein